ncbi:EXTL2, alpha-1,4-N-acetylhexosaminyltransferase [Corchorus capsularis]|uniref:EXTL2, alpha-1,4-N-acetylhexosaminyltransferase n=1 Tax=Corchorus capsularis TaxID=210143 RepID=A0A1R3H549_COCAP|nr:EXTL2, alpha-1,4-N-acetylhexosaminyltransferase [Corchorus capsularis]
MAVYADYLPSQQLGLAYNAKRNILYVVDTENHALREIDFVSEKVRTLAVELKLFEPSGIIEAEIGKIFETGSTGISSLGGHSDRTQCVNKFVAEFGRMPLTMKKYAAAVDGSGDDEDY